MAEVNGDALPIEVDPKTVWLPPSQVARHERDKAKSRQLVDSIAQHGLINRPTLIEIPPRGVLVWEAMTGVGRTMAWMLAFPGKPMPAWHRKGCDRAVTGVDNLIHQDWEPGELMDYLLGLVEGGMQQQEIARKLGMDAGVVSGYLTIARKGCPLLLEGFRGGLIPFTTAAPIARQPLGEQFGLVEQARNGARREEVVRRTRKPKADAPKARCITVITPAGSKATIKGNDLSLEQAIEELREAVKIMERGLKDGLSAKTISKASAERAKAGGWLANRWPPLDPVMRGWERSTARFEGTVNVAMVKKSDHAK
jgi:hypothetical protein